MSGSPTVPDFAAPRRPLKTRQGAWAQALARMLTRAGVAPNAISMASLVFAIGAGLCLAWTARAEGLARQMLFLAVAACIQIRLLCNMLDGLVAVEGGKRTVFGEIFNDMPDRLRRRCDSVGVKDYSTLIRGHGGILDRMDSMCFAAPVFFHIVRYFYVR